ncbi:SusC/RagA family TonB-linked outer membrane protein [Plebeiibacterium marinum]|uniref:TonB-dependent receptor n=1 Tax=Plebeiibacterium marinum TaxID=2992111 RepID=A0AAE3SIB6_9BACT|nr:TonB-dependent receptor [Plebeiobacterium marinum]MCW3804560.1 TonB-dependent receptor [Plebeiobacterium marinum]
MKKNSFESRILRNIILSLFMLSFIPITAQVKEDVSISGTIMDQTGNPLPGVSVVIEGTNTGTISDVNGLFSIKAPTGSTLTLSFIGMESVTYNVTSPVNDLSITMVDQLTNLDVIVVTGYQSQKKADLTGAVGVVDMGAVKETPTGNAVKALQGRVAGVTVTTDGNPGAYATVRIRGGSTMGGGSNDPLYVIDGMPTTGGIEQLNPNDIETMQVLKDASAASIYGSRASNGVILITTKKGKEGQLKIEFNTYATVQKFSTKLDVLNTYERGLVNWQASINDGLTPTSSIYKYDWHTDGDNAVLDRILLPEYIDPARTMRPADTKWYDEVSQNSLIQSYNLTISNGNKKGNSLISLNYYDHNGIIKETNSNKITARINTDYNFFDGKLKVGENFTISRVDNVDIPVDDVMYLALVQQPVVPVYSVDGGWGGPAPGMTDRHNPVRLIEQNKQNHSKTARVFGNIFADLEIIKDLHFRTNYGIDYTENYYRKMDYSYMSGFLISDINRVATSQMHNLSYTWTNTLNYKFEFGKHVADIVAGTEAVKAEYESFYGSREGYIIEDADYMFLDAGTEKILNGGGGAGNSLFSYFAKINYVFDSKYLFSGTVRRDGSSRFGKDNLYGVFPAFSVGWRMSEESFIKDNFDAISNLKLRAGWGITGNQEISNEAIYSIYRTDYGIDPTWDFDSGTAYDITGSDTGTLPSGFRKIREGNPMLKWEEANQTNFGIDFGFFNQALYGSMDYFFKETNDILIEPPYLAVKGEGGNQWQNGATLENKGWEFVIGYNKAFSNGIKMDLSANISSYKREVTFLPDEVLTGYPGDPATGKTVLGHSDVVHFGYIADGLFQNQEEVNNHAEQTGKGIGRIRYKDIGGLDADGNWVNQPDGVVDALDRTWIGDPTPEFEYGFNASFSYKNFDLNLFFQGIYGADVYNEYKHLTDFTSIWQGTNFGSRTLDAWSPTNSGSTIPMLTLTDTNNENRTSTYFIENGSYLKLRNLQVGYTIPEQLAQKIGLTSARIYLQGQNLFTIKDNKGKDKFTGVDPESPGFAYPIPASYTIGVNLNF